MAKGTGRGGLDARTTSMIIVALAVIGWVLMVVVLAEKGSFFKFKSCDRWRCYGHYTCGVFKCERGGTLDGSSFDDKAGAIQAFGVMGNILMGVTMIIHLLQAFGKGSVVPPQLQDNMKVVHVVSAVFLLIMWAIMASCYDSLHKVTYGLFMVIACMIFELVLAYFCHTGAGGSSAGAQPLMG